MNSLEIRPIAHIKTDFKQKFGIPRQSGRVKSLRAKIVFCPEYRNPDALRDIEGFSHLWLIFDFSLAHRDEWSPTVRPPRLGGNKRVGVFASRSPFRPNPLGLSCVELIGVEKDIEYGHVLIVGGADLLDDTPIFDIKPYLPYSDCKENATSGYAQNEINHRLDVIFDSNLLKKIPQEKRQPLIDCLADDPRPSYQEDGERIYRMSFDGFDVGFKVDKNVLTVLDVK
ncbi:MAG: tRNA (N6-threonylcarbamoyladenosine(37)-N6)-methyltransferase TrmO [Clostridia bacterium]|nr:tRNA (N6-threonylcarbamoyladenosine(37)-N6)-methyltransferase TrmO [Clostridia bacterium]